MNTAMQKLLAFVFNQIVRQDFLAGNRSYIAGASAILGAVVIVLDMVVRGEFDEARAGAAWAAFVFGQTVIGNAGKRDALIQATQVAGVQQAIATTVAGAKQVAATEVASEKQVEAIEAVTDDAAAVRREEV